MNNQELLNLDEEFICNSLKIRLAPIIASQGKGSYLYDEEGNKFLDFTGNWAVANTGYCHPKIIDAINSQTQKNTFASFATVISKPTVELAKKLTNYMPGDFEKKVWFGLSGSDANDYISKIIPYVTGRNRIITYFGAYHGQTMGSLSMSGHTAQARFIGNGNIVKIPYPYCYRCPFNKEKNKCGLDCLDFLEDHVFTTICPPNDTAAVVIEAIQCDGGQVVPPSDYLEGLSDLCKKHGILLIFDEVKIGIGRTGKFFGFENFNITPDVVVFGKPIASGLPLSGVIAKKEIINDAPPASHLFTTAGNPISTAAGIATLEVIEEENLSENAINIGKFIKNELKKMQKKHEIIGDVRGMGMTIGVELVKDKKTKTPAKKETAKITISAHEKGLLVFYVGVHSNVLEITPPLVLTKAEAKEGLEKLEAAISDVEEGKISDKKLEKFAGW